MADRHLREANLARDVACPHLMRGKRVGLHEHDGGTSEPACKCSFEVVSEPRLIDGTSVSPERQHPLSGPDHPGIEHRRLIDPAREDLGPRLRANSS